MTPVPESLVALRRQVAASADPKTGQPSKAHVEQLAAAEQEWTASFLP